MKGCLRPLLTLLMTALLVPVQADTLQPFEAEYRINVSRIPTAIKARLVLEDLGSDRYRMALSIHSMLMKNRETSLFQWRRCAPRTLSYEHDYRGLGRRRQHEMSFHWEAQPPYVTGVAGSDEEAPRPFHYTVEDGVLDELVMLLKARCILQPGQQDYTLQTAYGRRLRNHLITVVGEETLNTPLGRLRTLRIEKRRDQDSSRRSIFWLAPDLDYLLVRARHVEGPGLFGELKLSRYEGPFKTDTTMPPDGNGQVPAEHHGDAALPTELP